MIKTKLHPIVEKITTEFPVALFRCQQKPDSNLNEASEHKKAELGWKSSAMRQALEDQKRTPQDGQIATEHVLWRAPEDALSKRKQLLPDEMINLSLN
jgi:hypothetical protein